MTTEKSTPHKVAVLGASDNPERTSNQLIRRLLAKGHEIFPIHPALKTIEGLAVYPDLKSLPAGIDVLSMYVNAQRSEALTEAILATGIPMIIFNPGAENPTLAQRLETQGRETQKACSLVLSSMDQL